MGIGTFFGANHQSTDNTTTNHDELATSGNRFLGGGNIGGMRVEGSLNVASKDALNVAGQAVHESISAGVAQNNAADRLTAHLSDNATSALLAQHKANLAEADMNRASFTNMHSKDLEYGSNLINAQTSSIAHLADISIDNATALGKFDRETNRIRAVRDSECVTASMTALSNVATTKTDGGASVFLKCVVVAVVGLVAALSLKKAF